MYTINKYPEPWGMKGIDPSGDGPGKVGREWPVHYYEALARDIRNECLHELLDGAARRAFRLVKDTVFNVFAGIKRRRAIASTSRVLFVLDDSTLRDIGIDRGQIWSQAIAAVDDAAGTERFKAAVETTTPESRDAAKNEESMPMAA